MCAFDYEEGRKYGLADTHSCHHCDWRNIAEHSLPDLRHNWLYMMNEVLSWRPSRNITIRCEFSIVQIVQLIGIYRILSHNILKRGDVSCECLGSACLKTFLGLLARMSVSEAVHISLWKAFDIGRPRGQATKRQLIFSCDGHDSNEFMKGVKEILGVTWFAVVRTTEHNIANDCYSVLVSASRPCCVGVLQQTYVFYGSRTCSVERGPERSLFECWGFPLGNDWIALGRGGRLASNDHLSSDAWFLLLTRK